MNRRAFFTQAGLLVGAASLGIFVPKFEPVKWKIVRPKILLTPSEVLDGRWKQTPWKYLGSFGEPLWHEVWSETIVCKEPFPANAGNTIRT